MRAVAIIVAVVVAVVLVLVVVQSLKGLGNRRSAKLLRQARWQLHHYSENGQTVVAVSRMLPNGQVLESHMVQSIADSDPNWANLFNAAKFEAEERAFHLNGGGSQAQLPPGNPAG